ncbi:MAG: riboflavin synthase [Cellvibrionales bacterium]|jgi:riboflavin synthase|nr:riboflavin synthase [Cellvibrionales bacterium]MBT5923859.1 riboflavin synthase [Cellvibrionales bacterium]
MFTGLIQAKGSIKKIEDVGGDKRLLINSAELPLENVELGASIAINGVCLTAVEFVEKGFWVDVSIETLTHTTLGDLQEGSAVNLEKSLTPSSFLGGHLVSGHVDGVGEIVERYEDGRSWRFSIRSPEPFAKYIAQKGSICVDGTSLTVNAVSGAVFELNIIPHTFDETLFGDYQVGSRVNLEVDVIARYLERMSAYQSE